MTKDEAVERWLYGAEWTECIYCEGQGRLFHRPKPTLLEAVRDAIYPTPPVVRSTTREQLQVLHWNAIGNQAVYEGRETKNILAHGVYLPCHICQSVPFSIPEDFVEACALLGKELPTLVQRVSVIDGDQMKRKVEHHLRIGAYLDSHPQLSLDPKGDCRLTHEPVDPPILTPGRVKVVWQDYNHEYYAQENPKESRPVESHLAISAAPPENVDGKDSLLPVRSNQVGFEFMEDYPSTLVATVVPKPWIHHVVVKQG